MKLKYLIYTITLTSLTACSDFLEPKSQSKYIPKDANALQEMLIGEAYPQQGNTKFLAYLEILADEFCCFFPRSHPNPIGLILTIGILAVSVSCNRERNDALSRSRCTEFRVTSKTTHNRYMIEHKHSPLK